MIQDRSNFINDAGSDQPRKCWSGSGCL